MVNHVTPLMATAGPANLPRGEEEDEEEEEGGEDITDDDFLEQAFSQDIDQAESEITEAYIRSITDRLSKGDILSDRDDTGLVKDLQDTLRGYVTVECNAQVVEDTASNLYYEVITNATKDYQELIDMAVLLLNAPKSPGGMQNHSLEQNQVARQKQLENFLAKYQQKFPDYSFESVTGVVQSYEDIMEHIVSFFQCLGQRSKMAVIVYNGHGTQKGTLSLEKEPTSISNTQFLDDIQSLWEAYRGKDYRQKNRPVSLPMRVKVILAHCYGHVHEKSVSREKIQAVSLSTEAKPITTSKIWWNTRNIAPHTRVIDSIHEDLERYTTTRDGRASEVYVMGRDIQHRQEWGDSVRISVLDSEAMSSVPESRSDGVRIPDNSGAGGMVGQEPIQPGVEYRITAVTATDAVPVNDVKHTSCAGPGSIDQKRLRTKYRTLPSISFVRTFSQVAKRRSGYRTIETQKLVRRSLPPNLLILDNNKALDTTPTTGRAAQEIVIQNIPQKIERKPAGNMTPKPCVVMRDREEGSELQDIAPRCNHRFCQSYYNSVYGAEKEEVRGAETASSGTPNDVMPVDMTPSPSVSTGAYSCTSRLRLVQEDNMSITSSCIFCCYKCKKARNSRHSQE